MSDFLYHYYIILVLPYLEVFNAHILQKTFLLVKGLCFSVFKLGLRFLQFHSPLRLLSTIKGCKSSIYATIISCSSLFWLKHFLCRKIYLLTSWDAIQVVEVLCYQE